MGGFSLVHWGQGSACVHLVLGGSLGVWSGCGVGPGVGPSGGAGGGPGGAGAGVLEERGYSLA